MKSVLFGALFLILFMACENPNAQKEKVVFGPEAVKVYEKFNDLSPRFFNASDSVYVVNFWATSCPPCIKEMPHFKEIEKKYAEEPLKIHLVSLDMSRDLEKRVKPFVEKHELTAEVSLLADQNYSAWTEKIDSSWYGALPATLIIKGNKRSFSFGAFESVEEIEAQLLEAM